MPFEGLMLSRNIPIPSTPHVSDKTIQNSTKKRTIYVEWACPKRTTGQSGQTKVPRPGGHVQCFDSALLPFRWYLHRHLRPYHHLHLFRLLFRPSALLWRAVCSYNERTNPAEPKQNPHTRTFASQARYTPIVKRSVSVSASASASASVPVPAASGERDTQIHRYSARTQRYGSSLPAFASYSSYMAYGPYGSGLWHSLYAVYFILQRQKLYYVRSSDWLGHSVQRKFYTVNRAATEPKSSRFYRFAAIKTQITRLFRTGECQVLHYDWFVIV